ncbi:hypothetical protein N7447_006043 [Penicillium robsamsonii]|uniref:uncharacterized protein n=1 Tax=Penicillium robsamsonii TaxID=1792511 RepID=UPI00254739D1|nr:uncharacterized protein N7447_006043 [Penicillium robsamsonii]KAJ5823703.1 hypothetical protein N7447_006043 [Penicillium robsamsonii]
MLSIKSLLNPQPERRSPYPFPAREKRQKMAKDAPIFRRGKIQGECRYPPCEERDAELEKAHRELSLRPLGNIADYPRQIPYASDKKTFQEKTGRDSFHVFQYTFRIPGEEKEWHVMWDYNIGITTPAKMLNQNPGLRDICHSITGGALSAQGYWMPYEAARAMATTFCWRIRYALTPLFGTDFPAMCIPPTDRKSHGRMVIPSEIVQRATDTSNYYRSLETKSSNAASSPAVNKPSSTHTLLNGIGLLGRKDSLTLPPLKIPRTQYAESNPSARDSSMEPYFMSPKSQSPMSTFTPINPPRSLNSMPRSRIESPRTILRALSDAMRPENVPGGISEDSDTDSDGSSNMYSTPNCPSVDGNMETDKLGLDEPNDAPEVPAMQSDFDDLTDSDDDWQMDDADDEDYRGPPLKRTLGGASSIKDSSTSPASQTKKYPSRKSRAACPQSSPHFTREVKAAEALLRLHMNELESATEMDDDGMTSPSGSRSLDGDESRSRKRRRASL